MVRARGIALLAPAQIGLPVAEYAPNAVKKTVVGSGHAEKQQVSAMLGYLLPKAKPKTHDEVDALAIAITHAHHRQVSARLAEQTKKSTSLTQHNLRKQNMIGKLKGIIDTVGEDWVFYLMLVVFCYEVSCSSRTLGALPSAGEAAILSIENLCS